MNYPWQPADGHLLTHWAEEMDPASPWQEYPRPQMTRSRWMNLNGLWDYTLVPQNVERIERYYQQILVPFPLESSLSGVMQPLLPDQRLWYRRTFRVPSAWAGERILLHFGAVDWQAEVWVNGKRVGTHLGGYLPFHFDITTYLWQGENVLQVAVWDPTDLGLQECGKQSLHPDEMTHTAVSGIWQTVWLEPVPPTYIDSFTLTPDLSTNRLMLDVVLGGETRGTLLRAQAQIHGQEVASTEGMTWIPFALEIPDPHLWSPQDPFLYDLSLTLYKNGTQVDTVGSYFAMRQWDILPDRKGIPRLCLNRRPLFQLGLLDQGYWPDGLYTPPGQEAMISDLEFAKNLGFNLIRKHAKVESDRWYAACDRLGLIVWQDMPAGGKPVPETAISLTARLGLQLRGNRDYIRFGRSDEANRAQYRADLQEMIDRLRNHPCIAVWVPFQEGWGQFDAREIGEWIREYDPSRLVDHASGWFDKGGPSFLSRHSSGKKLEAFSDRNGRPWVLSEIGGFYFSVPGHTSRETSKPVSSQAERTESYRLLLEKELIPLIHQGLSAAIYSRLADVEGETNGLLTGDRRVVKVDADRVEPLHRTITQSLE